MCVCMCVCAGPRVCECVQGDSFLKQSFACCFLYLNNPPGCLLLTFLAFPERVIEQGLEV